MAGIRKEIMPTLSEMINDVKSNLIGYTLRQDRITYVANIVCYPMSSTFWIRHVGVFNNNE